MLGKYREITSGLASRMAKDLFRLKVLVGFSSLFIGSTKWVICHVLHYKHFSYLTELESIISLWFNVKLLGIVMYSKEQVINFKLWDQFGSDRENNWWKCQAMLNETLKKLWGSANLLWKFWSLSPNHCHAGSTLQHQCCRIESHFK